MLASWINKQIESHEGWIQRLYTGHNDLSERIDEIMAQIDDLRAGEATLRDALTSLGMDMQAKLDTIQSQLDASAGGPDLSGDISALQDMVSQVQSIGQEAPSTPSAAGTDIAGAPGSVSSDTPGPAPVVTVNDANQSPVNTPETPVPNPVDLVNSANADAASGGGGEERTTNCPNCNSTQLRAYVGANNTFQYHCDNCGHDAQIADTPQSAYAAQS